MIIYDSRSGEFKEPFGAIRTGMECTIRIKLDRVFSPSGATLLLYRWGEEEPCREIDMWYDGDDVREEQTAAVFQARFTLDEPWTYFYCFSFWSDGRKWYIKKGPENRGHITPWDGELYQLTVYDKEMKTPDYQGAGLCYNLWPDGFHRSGKPKRGIPKDRIRRINVHDMPLHKYGEIAQDYWGGDLAGIEQRLDYLAGLGVTMIYMNPICEAHSNHRYNAANYFNIDPMLGDWDDLRSLCRAAEKRGIRIVFDGVFNHVGSDSVYFNKEGRYDTVGAYNSMDSEYFDYFMFQDYPQVYSCWWGDKSLPALNKQNEKVVEMICGENGVLARYLQAGVSGVRLDVADELPDALLDQIRSTVKKHGDDKIVIGEVWEDATHKESYSVKRRYLLGAQLDGTMNYPFRNAMYAYILDANVPFFAETTLSIYENYPPEVMRSCWTICSGHDDARMLSVLAMDGHVQKDRDREWELAHDALTPEQYALGRQRAKIMALIQYFLPGTPLLYYGNEAGMCGFYDPFNRKSFPWGGEDQELVEYYRALGALRSAHPELRDADYRIISIDESVLIFARGSVMIAVNRTADREHITLPAPFDNGAVLFTVNDSCVGELNGYGAVVVTVS